MSAGPVSFAAPQKVLFDDPKLQRALEMIVALAEELSVTQDRLDDLVGLLARTGAVAPSELETYQPQIQEEDARAARRRALLHRLFAGLHDELDRTAD